MPATSYIPTEVLSSILDHLPPKALAPLRTVSTTFLDLINPRIFSRLTLNVDTLNYSEKDLNLIKSFSTSSSTVSSFIKTVREVELYTGLGHDEDDNDYFIHVKAVEDTLSGDLALFLTKLQNLETLRWSHNVDQEPSLYLITIAQSLSAITKLQNVSIRIRSYDDDLASLEHYKLPPLHTFKNLSSLSVSCFYDIPTAYCNKQIATAITASPELTRFTLRNVVNFLLIPLDKECTSLQNLFRNVASPQLITLTLGYVPLPAAGLKQILSHKLKSLIIFTPINFYRLDFAWAKLFTCLSETRAELSTLHITNMDAGMNEMVDYLSSYRGIKTLVIRGIMKDRQDQEDGAGKRFWDKVVTLHKGSLTKLHIQPYYEGSWSFGPSKEEVKEQCSSLGKFICETCARIGL